MLGKESKKWLKTDNSRTEKRISKYIIAIDMLIDFVKEKNFKAFIISFGEYEINSKSIRACFFGSSIQTKDRASFVFKEICKRIILVLKKETISKMVENMIIDKQKPMEFFNKQL